MMEIKNINERRVNKMKKKVKIIVISTIVIALLAFVFNIIPLENAPVWTLSNSVTYNA